MGGLHFHASFEIPLAFDFLVHALALVSTLGHIPLMLSATCYPFMNINHINKFPLSEDIRF